jgi:hypothetical protein
MGLIFGGLFSATIGHAISSRRAVTQAAEVCAAGSFLRFAAECARRGGSTDAYYSSRAFGYGWTPELTCTISEMIKP